MTEAPRRPIDRDRHVLTSLVPLVVVALVAAVLTLGVTSAGAATPTSGRIDKRLDQRQCALLGRVWSSGIETTPPHRRSVGCRIDVCLDPKASMRAVTGQEVCYYGNQTVGPRYGAYVDSRVCVALHRLWIPQVNMCASNPFRSRPLVDPARQCTGSTSVYLTLREKEGYFDECVTRARYEKLRDLARSSGRSLTVVATARSQVNCRQRPDQVFQGGRCVRRGGTLPPTKRILITGESVMWRGHNELEDLRPQWSVDALPGRQIGDLPDRISHETHTRGRPAQVIVGLGTNPTPDFGRDDLVAALEPLGDRAHVMFVLPFRGSGTKAQLAMVADYDRWERAIAEDSPGHRCIADFPAFVKSHDVLGSDGIHPQPAKEKVYAAYVTRSWNTCLQQFSDEAQKRWQSMSAASATVQPAATTWTVASPV